MMPSHELIRNSLLAFALAVVLMPRGLPAQPGQLKWAFDTGRWVYSSPAIGPDGTVYLGSLNCKVYALDGATGTRKWAACCGDVLSTSSAAVGTDGTVYSVDCVDGSAAVSALNGATGAVKWRFTPTVALASGAMSTPAIGLDGRVYVVVGFCRMDWPWAVLFALDGATGAEQWAFNLGRDTDASPGVGADGTVYVGSQTGTFYALNGATGDKKWEFGAGGSIGSSSPAIDADGTIYVGSDDGRLYALDGATGAQKWAFVTGGRVRSSPAIGAERTLYVGSGDGKLYALDTASGAQKWAAVIGGTGQWQFSSSPAVGADRTVYIGSEDGKVYALDGETGTRKWTFPTGGCVVSSPALGVDGMLYVGSEDGKVYALQASGGLADTPWPKFHQNAQNTGHGPFAPRVLDQPSWMVLKEGAAGRIAFRVAGQPPPSFQWLFNGQPIPGATQATLTIPSVTRADEGAYTVVASNRLGQVTSDPIRALVSNVDPQSFVGLKWEGGSVGPVSLEATAQLGEAAAWHSISNYPSSTATQLYVDLDTGDAARFYRLNAPAALEFSAAGLLNGWWLTEPAGTRVRIEIVSAATGWTGWQELTTLVLPASPHLFLDFESLGAPERVYRTTVVP